MRSLTFGVLIVLVGFVAALPFRKAASPGMVDTAASLATGPSPNLATSLDSVPFDPLLVTSQAGPAWRESAAAAVPVRSYPGISGSLASQIQGSRGIGGIPSDAVARPRRDLNLPLTYDDLAVPLATPHYVDERFDAVAKSVPTEPAMDSQPSKYESMRFTGGVEGTGVNPYRRFDTMAPSIMAPSIMAPSIMAPSIMGSDPKAVPLPVINVAPVNSSAPAESTRVEGRLASDQRPADAPEPANQTVPAKPERVRHWIRQPQ